MIVYIDIDIDLVDIDIDVDIDVDVDIIVYVYIYVQLGYTPVTTHSDRDAPDLHPRLQSRCLGGSPRRRCC